MPSAEAPNVATRSFDHHCAVTQSSVARPSGPSSRNTVSVPVEAPVPRTSWTTHAYPQRPNRRHTSRRPSLPYGVRCSTTGHGPDPLPKGT